MTLYNRIAAHGQLGTAAPHLWHPASLCAGGPIAFLCSAAATCAAEDVEAVEIVLRAAVVMRTVRVHAAGGFGPL